MSTLLWLLFAFLYVVLCATRALATLRKGHIALFWVGTISPVLWAPTVRAEARGAA